MIVASKGPAGAARLTCGMGGGRGAVYPEAAEHSCTTGGHPYPEASASLSRAFLDVPAGRRAREGLSNHDLDFASLDARTSGSSFTGKRVRIPRNRAPWVDVEKQGVSDE